ncbi:MAG: cytochrome-c peroxidase [Woeseiaceae bacterium]|nr:cytochrome-c peroxidase [Woeseiaceae bacterium]
MSRRKVPALILVVTLILVSAAISYALPRFSAPAGWSEDERRVLRSLWIESLSPLPDDPSNAVSDLVDAARFGQQLFFEPAFSANGMISCATCHQPVRRFTDGLPTGVALGVTARNTPSIVGTAYSPWQYWDGRKDSQWSQALSPIEDPQEHGGNRLQVIGVIATNPQYRNQYEMLFGGPPDLADASEIDAAFANVGKAIAAYERQLLPGRSRFDDYVTHLEAGGHYLDQDILTRDEVSGLRLFIGRANCTECHNGPLLTNQEFHNTGLLSVPGELPDRGRIDGLALLRTDPFNCLGEFSDDPEQRCEELSFVRSGPELIGATRTPSLRNLGNTQPYQSKGQFAGLTEVLRHYNTAPVAMIGHNEAKPLGFRDWELKRLEAFLHTLDAPLATDPEWLSPPSR